MNYRGPAPGRGPAAIMYLFIDSASGLTPFVSGGFHWPAVIYAFWEQMAGVMIIMAMLWIFSLWFNHPGPVTRSMAGDSYTVYINHPVVIVIISLAFAIFAIELPLGLGWTFALAHGIRSVPGLTTVP